MSRKNLDQAQKHITELRSLAPPEQSNYLARLRVEDSSLYSHVSALLETAGENSGTFQPETIEYCLSQLEIPTDSVLEVQHPSLSELRRIFAETLEQGGLPRIEDYLVQIPEALRAELLEELIQIEIQAGQAEHAGGFHDYVRRFPGNRQAVERAFLHLDGSSLVESDDTTRVGEWSGQDVGSLLHPDEVIEPSVMFGDYEILREIARGGMGIVLEARQRSLNRRVALKMIRSGALANQEEVFRFRAEAENAARLNHPNIVPVYEVGEHKGQHYFTMALIEGESLSARLRKGPLPPQEAARILRLVARGVQYAHDRGVVHRDLKPGNILLDEDGLPHVADFGLAKQIGQDSKITVTGCVLGTPSFMPPEQARGEEAGTYSDIYSLGAILYTMLTNRPPFQAANSAETIQQVKEKEPVPPRQLNPAINQDLQTICLKCLEKNPARRYESCQALADELDRFLGGRPILARPVSSLERGWRWCVRHPARAALLLVSFLAVIALGFGVYFRHEAQANSQLAELRARELQAASDLAREKQKLAETEQYYSKISGVREAIATRPTAWTWLAEKSLAAAEKLQVESKDRLELRSLIATARSEFDLRPIAQFQDVEPGQIAINPEGTLLAVTTLKGVPEAKVYVYDLTRPAEQMPSPKNARVYSFSTLKENLARWFGGDTQRFQERITALQFGPNGRWLIAGTRHGKLHAWDLSSPGEPWKSWTAHAGEVRQVAWSPDGEWFYSTSSDENGRTKCWRVSEEFPLEGQLDVPAQAIGLTYDGGRLVVANDESLVSFDPRTLKSPIKLCETHVRYARFAASPTSDLAAAYIQPSEVSLIDLRDGSLQGTLADPQGVEFGVRELRFAKSGLIFAACTDDTVRIWDASSGELMAALGAGGQYNPELAASRDGHWLAATNAGMTELYEVRLPDLQQVTAIAPGEIMDFGFPASGGLVTLVEKTKTKTAELTGSWLETWDPADGRRIGQRALALSGQKTPKDFRRASSEGRPTRSLEFSRDGDLAAILTSQFGPVIDRSDGKTSKDSRPNVPILPLIQTGEFRSLALSPDGSSLWALGRTETLVGWSAPDWKVVHHSTGTLESHLKGAGGFTTLEAANEWLLIGHRRGQVSAHRMEDGKLTLIAKRDEYDGVIEDIAVHPGERLAVVGTSQGELKVIDVPSCRARQVLDRHRLAVRAVDFSSDGRWIASGSRDQTVRIWRESPDGYRRHVDLGPFSSAVERVHFSENGRWLAIRIQGERGVRIWNFEKLRAE